MNGDGFATVKNRQNPLRAGRKILKTRHRTAWESVTPKGNSVSNTNAGKMNVDAESEKAAKRHQKLLDDAKLDAIPGWLGVIVDGLLVCWILGLNVILAIFEVVMLAGLWLMGITKRSKKTK